MPKSPAGVSVNRMAQKTDEVVRVNFRVRGEFLERLREVRELCALTSESEAARYLVNRGFEAMNAQLQVLRLYRRLEREFSPQELLPLIEQIEKGGK